LAIFHEERFQPMRAKGPQGDGEKSHDASNTESGGRIHLAQSTPKTPKSEIENLTSDISKSPWPGWQPRERANLCFIVQGLRVLLIRKKRGLGAGKINGPGGKIEPGETPLQSAIREAQEEIGVTPSELEERGLLHFQFTDGYSLQCTVFIARAFTGEPIETVEATPMWFDFNQVPYDEMWEDDQYWLPQVLNGSRFIAWFDFDGEKMLSKDVRFDPR
jgi:8-oxo-dGTP diphosphatase